MDHGQNDDTSCIKVTNVIASDLGGAVVIVTLAVIK